MWLYPEGRACRPNSHRNAHTLMSGEHKKLTHWCPANTTTHTHWCPANTNTAPPSLSNYSPQTTTVSRGKEQRPHSNTRRTVYTLQTQASESHTTDTAQRNTTNTNKGNFLELQPIGSRDTNTELPHNASYWITLLSSLHSAVKPAWRARQNTDRLYELKGETTVDEHWRTPQREGTLNTRFHKSLGHTRQIYAETQPHGTAQLHTQSQPQKHSTGTHGVTATEYTTIQILLNNGEHNTNTDTGGWTSCKVRK